MSNFIDRELIMKKVSEIIDYCEKDKNVNGLTALFQVVDAIIDCPDKSIEQLLRGQWISVKEDMPKEKDSIFKKWKNTDKWIKGMFERVSDYVNVTVKFSDGSKKVYTTFTKDGEWTNLPEFGNPIVTHWMRLPEPAEED